MTTPEITSYTFICDVKIDGEPKHILVQVGDPAIGLTVQVILTPEQARTLADLLHGAAKAVSRGHDFVS